MSVKILLNTMYSAYEQMTNLKRYNEYMAVIFFYTCIITLFNELLQRKRIPVKPGPGGTPDKKNKHQRDNCNIENLRQYKLKNEK